MKFTHDFKSSQTMSDLEQAKTEMALHLIHAPLFNTLERLFETTRISWESSVEYGEIRLRWRRDDVKWEIVVFSRGTNTLTVNVHYDSSNKSDVKGGNIKMQGSFAIIASNIYSVFFPMWKKYGN